MIKCLQSKIETDFAVTVSEAVFTSIHLLALYQDDLEDAASYAGIKYITPKRLFRLFFGKQGRHMLDTVLDCV
jgi:hypothetical protein